MNVLTSVRGWLLYVLAECAAAECNYPYELERINKKGPRFLAVPFESKRPEAHKKIA